MRSPRRKTTAASWPFAVLMLAWLCANCPQAAVYALVWIGEAHSFSHQQRLSVDVARVLVGEDAPSRLAEIKLPTPAPEKTTLPASATLKKIELAVEEYIPPAAPNEPVGTLSERALDWRSAFRTPPPHEPPRAALVS